MHSRNDRYHHGPGDEDDHTMKEIVFLCILNLSLGRVQENEALYRNIDDDEETFRCPVGYIPVFADEALTSLNETTLRAAEAVCGNDVTCLFDVAATGNLAIGQSTLSENAELTNEVTDLGKILFL